MTDQEKAALEVIRHEVGYRREKQWKIFSWTATILVAVIAGVITLVGDDKFKFPLWPQRAAMAAATIVITVYACHWIHENITFESGARDALTGFFKDNEISKNVIPDPRTSPHFGYSATLILLAVAAVATVLFAGW
ncbi:MAG TPA: hypothetical protein VGQ41_20525 [Pyrinomonadaceae bacterium]|jgi:hypothetical protein|nr:hypothetical protein [Pyrinomonadaceae bacterium]